MERRRYGCLLYTSLEAPRGSLPYSLTPARYGAFLEELFDLWCADLLAGDPVSIRYFDNLADLCLSLIHI